MSEEKKEPIDTVLEVQKGTIDITQIFKRVDAAIPPVEVKKNG